MSVEIIAEIAQGFEGRVEQASLLVKAAASAGADAAKFQMVYASELATPDYKYFDLFSSLEMRDEDWARLAEESRSEGIKLLVDIFGEKSLRLAQEINVSGVKLHPTDLRNTGFLSQVAASSVPRVYLGAGGGRLSEIERALTLLSGKEVVVLLGFQAYPTMTEANQVRRVAYLKDKWAGKHNIIPGFADHADPATPMRFLIAGLAVGAGALVLEKHLTLGRNMKLEDHESALNPDEFEEFCTLIRTVEKAMGSVLSADDFGMDASEAQYRKTVQRHVIAAREIKSGSVIVAEDLCLKRSGAVKFETDLTAFYNRKAARTIAAGEPVTGSDVC